VQEKGAGEGEIEANEQAEVPKRSPCRRFTMAGLTELEKILTAQDYEYRYLSAKATGTCILCGRRALLFESASSQLEYRVSGLCQQCQDRHLSGAAVVP
jgi:hypothetical protein